MQLYDFKILNRSKLYEIIGPMDDWTGLENSQDINIFSDYETDSNDDKFHERKRKHAEAKENINKNSEADDRSFSKRVKDSGNVAQLDSVWSIEDDSFFYPLGICNHCISDANKSVIITWSECCVINFVIKKMINKKQTKTTRVRLNVPRNEIVKDVKILEYNTLLLLESGNVNYFSSAKSMHHLPWLSCVRCIGRTLDGFCIIRLTPEQRLLLEVYEDTVNMGKKAIGTVKQCYDITYDEQNLFNCTWEDESFHIFAVPIEPENSDFLEHLIAHTCDLKEQKEIFIFAVSGNIFVLIPDASNTELYHIEPIFSYASNIQFIKVDQVRKFCLIFLTCGSIDIWYMSNVTKILQRHQHHTGAMCVSFAYSDKRAALFLTDESQVVELTFYYNYLKDIFCVRETFKAISGIIVCTWIEAIEQLICLDCNNIFHQLSFEATAFANEQHDDDYTNENVVPTTTVAEYEKFNSLFELTPFRVSQLTEKANIMRQLNNLPKDLYETIENEYLKQQLLAVDDKRNYYCIQFKAHVKYSTQLHIDSQPDTLFLYANRHDLFGDQNIFAHISLKIACNDIFQNSNWQLHVIWNNSVQMFTLPCRFFDSNIEVVVPLKLCNEELPSDIQLMAYTFISHAADHVAISLPIRLNESFETYNALFSTFMKHDRRALNLYNLKNVFLQFKNEIVKSKPPFEFHHILYLPKKLNIKAVLKPFKLLSERGTILEDQTYTIHFLNHKISVSWESSKNVLHLKSDDAAALYYFKLSIIFADNKKEQQCGLYQLENYQQMLLRHQNCVERRYGDLAECDIMDASCSTLQNDRLKNLKQIYERMRKCLTTK